MEPGSAQPGVDFILSGGTFSWAAGDLTPRWITATILTDADPEAAIEDFTVDLFVSSPSIVVASAEGQGRILNDDDAVVSLLGPRPLVSTPKIVRIAYYDYRFATPEEHARNGDWWTRTFRGYLTSGQ